MHVLRPISRDERLQRIERARRLTRDAGADALIINAGASLRYFAGVPWGASERLVAMILPVDGEPVMVLSRVRKRVAGSRTRSPC